MIMRTTMLIILIALALPAHSQAPVAVAERTITRGEVATRVSLFSNHVVVVTVRRGDEQDFFRRLTLPEDQYMVYLASFQTAANELGEKPISSEVSTSNAEVVVSLHVGPDSPRVIRFSPMSGVDLPLARIMGALDDLELQVFEASPSAEAMRVWEPKEGDRVERFWNTSRPMSASLWPPSCGIR
jgi:hypothetical protein